MTDPVSLALAVSSSSPTTCVASTAAALPPEDIRQIALEVAAILKDTPSSSSNPLTSTTAETATGNLTPQRTAAMVVFWAHIAT